jgi:A/G-specific adenine glycosylase
MPWREEVSPYRTLVSEIMLQQTRVDTVIPYFERFMNAFPTVEALAAAPVERVLERWSGLGYYSRARNLHNAARAVAAAGGFPKSAAQLRELPGVGPYTAGAVASIALGLDEAVVDGNVERVICRQNAWAEDPKRIRARIWDTVRGLLPPGEAGDFNQAVMELGATVCTPVRPACLTCPVRGSCLGVGSPDRYPAKPARPVSPEARAVAALVREEGRLLLARRPSRGLLADLWEPPGGPGDDLSSALSSRLGLDLLEATPVGTVTHVFTHLKLHTAVYEARVAGELRVGSDYQDARWVPVGAIPDMALSTLARKLIRLGSAPSATPRTRRARKDPVLPS